MNDKTEIIIALSAAVGANCIPCFDHLYEKAKNVGITDDEVLFITETANKVKTGAAIFIKNAINDTIGLEPEVDQPCCAESEKACC